MGSTTKIREPSGKFSGNLSKQHKMKLFRVNILLCIAQEVKASYPQTKHQRFESSSQYVELKKKIRREKDWYGIPNLIIHLELY